MLEVPGSIHAAGEEKFGVQTCFPLCHLKVRFCHFGVSPVNCTDSGMKSTVRRPSLNGTFTGGPLYTPTKNLTSVILTNTCRLILQKYRSVHPGLNN